MLNKTLTFLALGCAFVVLCSRSSGVAEILNQDRTGAPGSSTNCAQCHNSGPWIVTTQIAVMDMVTQEIVEAYEPGGTYQVTYTIESTGSPVEYGFQGTAVLDSDASNAGSFSEPSSNTQLEDVNGRHIIEQNAPSPSNAFSVIWQAPASGAGSVSFYGVGVAVNGNGSTSGDDGSGSQQFTLQEAVVIVPGCTDPSACNFDPTANEDDGSCLLPDGCTDPSACNFSPNALCDDGSCQLPDGCTNPQACNYDVTATCDDNSCLFTCPGCTYAAATNYDPQANQEDGSCQFQEPEDLCGTGTFYNPITGQCEVEELSNACAADLNNDGTVGTSDILELLGAFAQSCE